MPAPEVIAALAAFYDPDRWRDEWGITRIVNGALTNPHRGHDVAAAPGETVPALRGGRVVLVSELSASRVLGYHVVVDTGKGFDYYCHLLVGTRPNVGDVLEAGDSVGLVAGWGDYTGTAWTGPHLHYGSGPNLRSVYEGTTYNATTIVRDTLTTISLAGLDPEKVITLMSWDTLLKGSDGKTITAGARLVGAHERSVDARAYAKSAADRGAEVTGALLEGYPYSDGSDQSLAARIAGTHGRIIDITDAIVAIGKVVGNIFTEVKALSARLGSVAPAKVTVAVEQAALNLAVKTALTDPDVVAGLASAINRDAAARLAE